MKIFSDMFPRLLRKSGAGLAWGAAIHNNPFRGTDWPLKARQMVETHQTFRGELALLDLGATARLGAGIAGGLKPGDAVALWGDLGAGKTTLARAILKALGVAGDVPSPTFTLVQMYETTPRVAHFDLYRLKTAREMEELGFEDALADGAVLVEWPERAPEVLPPDTLHVRLRQDDGARNARLTGPVRWESLMHV
jgi:tRNA threonylcarbamoyl adenosine modification protein YjeE